MEKMVEFYGAFLGGYTFGRFQPKCTASKPLENKDVTAVTAVTAVFDVSL